MFVHSSPAAPKGMSPYQSWLVFFAKHFTNTLYRARKYLRYLLAAGQSKGTLYFLLCEVLLRPTLIFILQKSNTNRTLIASLIMQHVDLLFLMPQRGISKMLLLRNVTARKGKELAR